MISEADKIAAAHETESTGKPWVLVRPWSWWSGFAHVPGRMLYNVVGGAMQVGSTVTAESLRKQGYRVELVD